MRRALSTFRAKSAWLGMSINGKGTMPTAYMPHYDFQEVSTYMYE